MCRQKHATRFNRICVTIILGLELILKVLGTTFLVLGSMRKLGRDKRWGLVKNYSRAVYFKAKLCKYFIPNCFKWTFSNVAIHGLTSDVINYLNPRKIMMSQHPLYRLRLFHFPTQVHFRIRQRMVLESFCQYSKLWPSTQEGTNEYWVMDL